MRIVAFENIGPGKLQGLQDGDELRLAYEGYTRDDGDTGAVLEAVFGFLNQDDRPNRLIRPSLSVGDVITLIGGPRSLLESWAVEKVGFRKVTLVIGSLPARLEYAREQRESGVANVTQIPREVRS